MSPETAASRSLCSRTGDGVKEEGTGGDLGDALGCHRISLWHPRGDWPGFRTKGLEPHLLSFSFWEWAPSSADPTGNSMTFLPVAS